ncbi:MAG: uroporphyrinogen-III C-methyltransferase [Rhizobiaceae bacterium]
MSPVRPESHVYLVGAGPGDPELLTIKAMRLIETADVIVHDRLVSNQILELAGPATRMIDVGKSPNHHPFPQPNINALLISLASKYCKIVRLKGGDPYLFGRGSEEAAALRDAGISFTAVPGISSAQGIASATGVPLTHRGLATGVRFVTGHCQAGHELDLDWRGLADGDTTLVIYMGRRHAQHIAERLIAHGMAPETPVMLVVDGTRATEQRHFTALGQLGQTAATLEKTRPVLIVIGGVVDLASDVLLQQDEIMEQASHG